VTPTGPDSYKLSSRLSNHTSLNMGCFSSKGSSKPQAAAAEKPVPAEKNAGENTLLVTPGSPGKAVSEQTGMVQHRMMRIPIKPGSVDGMLEIVKGPDMQKALNELAGLTHLEITKEPEEDVIFTHSRWQDKASMEAAEAKIAAMMKPLADYFAGAPWRFIATGGSLQFAGETILTFLPGATADAAEPATDKAPEGIKIVEEGQEPVFKLMGADDEQEVAVDEDRVLTAVKESPSEAKPASWLFGSCCVANIK